MLMPHSQLQRYLRRSFLGPSYRQIGWLRQISQRHPVGIGSVVLLLHRRLDVYCQYHKNNIPEPFSYLPLGLKWCELRL